MRRDHIAGNDYLLLFSLNDDSELTAGMSVIDFDAQAGKEFERLIDLVEKPRFVDRHHVLRTERIGFEIVGMLIRVPLLSPYMVLCARESHHWFSLGVGVGATPAMVKMKVGEYDVGHVFRLESGFGYQLSDVPIVLEVVVRQFAQVFRAYACIDQHQSVVCPNQYAVHSHQASVLAIA